MILSKTRSSPFPLIQLNQTAMAMPECDPIEQQKRSEFLDDLYMKSGRQDKGHEFHSRYTGLYQEYMKSKENEVNGGEENA